jgi:23S rRNA pseudouridine1911/1915/1917 synthase
MRLRIKPEDAGERLDVVLAEPLGSRSRAARLIAEGAVRVGGVPARKGQRLAGGEVVEVELELEAVVPGAGTPSPTGGEDEAAFGIAYEDEHLLVVDKPAGVVVHPARGHWSGTLAQALAARGAAGGEEDGRAGIVHRLDRDTSGLLVVARSEEVHRSLRALLGRREVTREYLALVRGRPDARSGTIDAPLGRDRHERTRNSLDSDRLRDAVTHFAVERALPRTTLLRVRLETGRTHQIRVHLEAIGHPVMGDPTYGRAGDLGLSRQFLHAARLAFTHPVTGEPVEAVSPLPPDLAAALTRAEAER